MSDQPLRMHPRIGPGALWFAVMGGPVAWAAHVVFGWSVIELGCQNRSMTALISPQGWAGVATAVPWLVTIAALVTAVRLHGHAREQQDVAALSVDRARLMTTVAIVLDVLALITITGGGVGILVLEPCVS